MSDDLEARIAALERNDKRQAAEIDRLKQAAPYFMVMGACWTLLWASFGAWCQRWLGG